MIVIIVALIISLLVGCEQKKEVELLPDFDKIYLTKENLDSTPKLLEPNSLENLQNFVIDKIEKMRSESQAKVIYNFDVKLFINEKGSIEKIQFLENPIIKTADNNIENWNKDIVFETIYNHILNWKFNPGTLGGSDVKSQLKWNFSLRTTEEGKLMPYFKYFEIPLPPVPEDFKTEEFNINADKMPFPVGGVATIAQNVKYPEIAKRAGIEGKVFIRAFIDENGDVVNAEVIKGIGAGCDESALIAVRKTKFDPGIKDGKPVRVQLSIPVMFKLQ